MPPIDVVRDGLLYAALLPMVAAALVYLLFTFIPRSAYVGAVLAVFVGFTAANLVREYPNWVHDPRVLPKPAPDEAEPDPNFDPRQVGWALATAVVGPSLGEPTVTTTRLWLPWCVVLAGLFGTIGRLPGMPTSLLRVAAAATVTILLVSPAIQKEASWLIPALILAIVAGWELAETVGKAEPGGWLPLSAAIGFAMSTVFILLAHTATYAEAAGYLAASCFGIAVVAMFRRSDASGLAPILAVALPGLMIVVRWAMDDEIPIAGYLAIALAPLGLTPAAIMTKCERVPRWVRKTAIVVGPVLVAAIGLGFGFVYGSLPTAE